MPGRANQMSATDAYGMQKSRWGVPLKVLTNKKALDAAFRQHTWTMQQGAAQMAGGERQQHIAGQYALKGAEMRMGGGEGGNQKNMQQAATLATKMLSDQYIMPGSPGYEEKWTQAYDMVLNQLSGQGEQSPAVSAASGIAPQTAMGAPFDANQPKRPGMFINPFDAQDRQNSIGAQRRKKKEASRAPLPSAGADSSASQGPIAVNPQTGEKVQWNGQAWVPLQ